MRDDDLQTIHAELNEWKMGYKIHGIVLMNLSPTYPKRKLADTEYANIINITDRLKWSMLSMYHLCDAKVWSNAQRSLVNSYFRGAIESCDIVILDINYATTDEYFLAGVATRMRKPIMVIGNPEPHLWDCDTLVTLPNISDLVLFADLFERYAHMPVFDSALRYVASQFPRRK